jgi:hypothetical protein
MIRGIVALNDVVSEARALVDSEDTVYAADNTTNNTPDDGTNRPGGALAFARTVFYSSRDALR